MQGTLINRKLKSLPVVLRLKKVKFLLDTIAWVRHGKFKRLAGRLMWCLGEREINGFWALVVKEVSHYGSLFFNNHHFNTNFHLQYVDFDTCWTAILNIPVQRLAGERTQVKRSPKFPHYCPNKLSQHSTLKYSTIISIHRGTVVHARLARVQYVDRINTLNKFTLLVWIKAFSAASGEDFTTLNLKHGGETWTNIALKSTQQTDTASAARGPTNMEHHNTPGGTPYMESV